MKSKLFPSLVLALSLLLSVPDRTHAQQTNGATVQYAGKSTKFAVMVSEVLHFRAALMTAEEMQTRKKNLTFEVVIVGELAKAIVEDASLLEDINKSEKLGIKLVVCEHALSYFKVSKEKLDKRVQTTRNAWVYMFLLKDNGYNTLSV